MYDIYIPFAEIEILCMVGNNSSFQIEPIALFTLRGPPGHLTMSETPCLPPLKLVIVTGWLWPETFMWPCNTSGPRVVPLSCVCLVSKRP